MEFHLTSVPACRNDRASVRPLKAINLSEIDDSAVDALNRPTKIKRPGLPLSVFQATKSSIIHKLVA